MDLQTLSTLDDLLSDLLLDRVNLWFQTHKMNKDYQPLNVPPEKILDIIQRRVIVDRKVPEAIKDLLEHARRYLSIYLPTAGFEISQTDRYSAVTHKSEACVIANRPLEVGSELRYCAGTIAILNEQEEKDLESRTSDFSVIRTSRKGTCLFLGPARFVNHDCDPNCSFMAAGSNVIYFKVLKPVNVNDEITTHYGDNYFGNNNQECLCATCERRGKGGYKKNKSSTPEPLPTPVSTPVQEGRRLRNRKGKGFNYYPHLAAKAAKHAATLASRSTSHPNETDTIPSTSAPSTPVSLNESTPTSDQPSSTDTLSGETPTNFDNGTPSSLTDNPSAGSPKQLVEGDSEDSRWIQPEEPTTITKGSSEISECVLTADNESEQLLIDSMRSLWVSDMGGVAKETDMEHQSRQPANTNDEDEIQEHQTQFKPLSAHNFRMSIDFLCHKRGGSVNDSESGSVVSEAGKTGSITPGIVNNGTRGNGEPIQCTTCKDTILEHGVVMETTCRRCHRHFSIYGIAWPSRSNQSLVARIQKEEKLAAAKLKAEEDARKKKEAEAARAAAKAKLKAELEVAKRIAIEQNALRAATMTAMNTEKKKAPKKRSSRNMSTSLTATDAMMSMFKVQGQTMHYDANRTAAAYRGSVSCGYSEYMTPPAQYTQSIGHNIGLYPTSTSAPYDNGYMTSKLIPRLPLKPIITDQHPFHHSPYLVFVDPQDDGQSPFWWVAMTVPRVQMDLSMPDLPKRDDGSVDPDLIIVRFLEDFKYSICNVSGLKLFRPNHEPYLSYVSILGRNFVKNLGVQRAHAYLRGDVPTALRWRFMSCENQLPLQEVSSYHATILQQFQRRQRTLQPKHQHRTMSTRLQPQDAFYGPYPQRRPYVELSQDSQQQSAQQNAMFQYGDQHDYPSQQRYHSQQRQYNRPPLHQQVYQQYDTEGQFVQHTRQYQLLMEYQEVDFHPHEQTQGSQEVPVSYHATQGCQRYHSESLPAPQATSLPTSDTPSQVDPPKKRRARGKGRKTIAKELEQEGRLNAETIELYGLRGYFADKAIPTPTTRKSKAILMEDAEGAVITHMQEQEDSQKTASRPVSTSKPKRSKKKQSISDIAGYEASPQASISEAKTPKKSKKKPAIASIADSVVQGSAGKDVTVANIAPEKIPRGGTEHSQTYRVLVAPVQSRFRSLPGLLKSERCTRLSGILWDRFEIEYKLIERNIIEGRHIEGGVSGYEDDACFPDSMRHDAFLLDANDLSRVSTPVSTISMETDTGFCHSRTLDDLDLDTKEGHDGSSIYPALEADTCSSSDSLSQPPSSLSSRMNSTVHSIYGDMEEEVDVMASEIASIGGMQHGGSPDIDIEGSISDEETHLRHTLSSTRNTMRSVQAMVPEDAPKSHRRKKVGAAQDDVTTNVPPPKAIRTELERLQEWYIKNSLPEGGLDSTRTRSGRVQRLQFTAIKEKSEVKRSTARSTKSRQQANKDTSTEHPVSLDGSSTMPARDRSRVLSGSVESNTWNDEERGTHPNARSKRNNGAILPQKRKRTRKLMYVMEPIKNEDDDNGKDEGQLQTIPQSKELQFLAQWTIKGDNVHFDLESNVRSVRSRTRAAAATDAASQSKTLPEANTRASTSKPAESFSVSASKPLVPPVTVAHGTGSSTRPATASCDKRSTQTQASTITESMADPTATVDDDDDDDDTTASKRRKRSRSTASVDEPKNDNATGENIVEAVEEAVEEAIEVLSQSVDISLVGANEDSNVMSTKPDVAEEPEDVGAVQELDSSAASTSSEDGPHPSSNDVSISPGRVSEPSEADSTTNSIEEARQGKAACNKGEQVTYDSAIDLPSTVHLNLKRTYKEDKNPAPLQESQTPPTASTLPSSASSSAPSRSTTGLFTSLMSPVKRLKTLRSPTDSLETGVKSGAYVIGNELAVQEDSASLPSKDTSRKEPSMQSLDDNLADRTAGASVTKEDEAAANDGIETASEVGVVAKDSSLELTATAVPAAPETTAEELRADSVLAPASEHNDNDDQSIQETPIPEPFNGGPEDEAKEAEVNPQRRGRKTKKSAQKTIKHIEVEVEAKIVAEIDGGRRWSRRVKEKKPPNTAIPKYKVGDKVLAPGENDVMFKSEIEAMREHKSLVDVYEYRVHYIGYGQRFNAWIEEHLLALE
ncbi:Histone-lysine N-methyltransferase set9 [Haplosporangium sp. Z 11]|nr:Histone-lysine N-methyltransferase set9 [Haplosporangium sp. Z 11]